MRTSLFITGGAGFVGRRVLRALSAAGARDVRLLVRDPASLSRSGVLAPHWQLVRGTLEDPSEWVSALRDIDTVLHLASSTGKARADVHHNTIVRGTARLLEHAESERVRRVLFVSSIAAGFAEQRFYPYAQSKRQAEIGVLASRLETLVVRPTMVLGPGSPPLAGLRRLAQLPWPVLFGPGTAMVQPIHVVDLAGLLVAAIDRVAPWGRQVITVGGDQVLTIEELLRAIRRLNGLEDIAPLHVPVEPLRTLLAIVEPALRRVLPFTAGQMSSFVESGVAGSPTPLHSYLKSQCERFQGVEAMVSSGVEHVV